MKTTTVLLPGVLVISILAAGRLSAETRIVVDFGPHASAEIAADGEADVDWLDADTADDTRCTECFAAVELQRYLRAMTARADDFAVVDDETEAPSGRGDVILVGRPASNAASRRLASALGIDAKQLADLGPEGYRIKSAAVDGRRVTLVAGGSRVGTLYGAYDVLYCMGCRWFAPGEIHEEVPRVEPTFEFDVTERPAFPARGFLAFEPRGNPEFLSWMARNRLNEWCVDPEHHPLMHKLGIRIACGEHDAQEQFLNPGGPYPYDHPRFQGDEENPMDPYPPSEQYLGDAGKDGR